MKLSQLINYRNQLRALDLTPMKDNVQHKVDHVLHLASGYPGDTQEFFLQLTQKGQHISQSICDFELQIDHLKQDIDHQIRAIETPYFLRSYDLYAEISNETLEDIINRQTTPSASVDYLRTRVQRLNTWLYPAMILRPGNETFINDMVACDPLYLVDLKHELLAPALNRYNNTYQNRLRTYVISEQSPDAMLHQLPDQQFGMILAYNYFNFRPFEVIRQWLAELFVKLQPGGMLLLTFNDCDNDKAVMLVEQNYCCYTPGHLVKQLAQTLGYEIQHEWSDQGPSTWLELQRPGTLTSLRGGQALAQIIPKAVAESK